MVSFLLNSQYYLNKTCIYLYFKPFYPHCNSFKKLLNEFHFRGSLAYFHINFTHGNSNCWVFLKYEYLLSDPFLTSGKGYLKSYDTLIAYANTRYMNSQCSVWYLDQFLLKNHINICLLKFQTTCTGTFFICEFLW